MQQSADKRERFTNLGRFVVRTIPCGRTLLYDVMTKSGQLVAAGFDMLSGNEEAALEGITDRLYGKGNSGGHERAA